MPAFLQPYYSLKALIIGFAGVCAFYCLFVGLTIFRGPGLIESIEASLENQIIPYVQEIHETTADPVSDPHHQQKNTDAKILHRDDKAMHAETTKNKEALPPAPYEGLIEETQNGFLPIISENNLAPFDAYKKPFISDRKKPLFALIIRNLNASAALTKKTIMTLPGNVTFLISPYDFHAGDIQQQLRSNGHETWLYVPFETQNFPTHDPGPKGLLSNAGLKFNQNNLEQTLGTTTGYAGVAGYTDTAFENVMPVFDGIFNDITKRGLGYFEMNNRGNSLGRKQAFKSGVPVATNTFSSDAKMQALPQKFMDLKTIASSKGHAILVLDLTPTLIEDLQEILHSTIADGYELAPLSAVTYSKN